MSYDKNAWKAEMAMMEARQQAKRDALAAALAASPAITLDQHGRRELWIVSGDMYAGAKGVRASFFDANGPYSHTESKDMGALLEDLAGRINDAAAATVQPATEEDVIAWTSTKEFDEGSKRVEARQLENEIRYSVSQLDDKDERLRANDWARDLFDQAYEAGQRDMDAALEMLRAAAREIRQRVAA